MISRLFFSRYEKNERIIIFFLHLRRVDDDKKIMKSTDDRYK